MGAFAATLATISAATYSNSLAGLPAGFNPLPLSRTVGGVFVNANAATSVTTGVLDGQSVVVPTSATSMPTIRNSPHWLPRWSSTPFRTTCRSW